MAVHLNFCTIIFSPLSDLTFKVTFDEKEYTWGTKMVNKLSHAAVMWVGPFLPMVTVFHHETIKAVLSTGGRLSKFYSRPFQKIPLFIIFWAQFHGYAYQRISVCRSREFCADAKCTSLVSREFLLVRVGTLRLY